MMSAPLRTWSWGLAIVISTVASSIVLGDDPPARPSLPAAWQDRWREPLAEDRPLQIVHGIEPRRAIPSGIDQVVHRPDAPAVASNGMRYYADLGLGGIVCNVAFQDYMRSEQHWQTLLSGVEACRELGLIVWIYDEDGYPSGAAGGLVLAENPVFEAQEIAFDASRPEPFILRPSYEHTHAANNYYAARRYANLIDDRAVNSFLRQTHDAYADRLKDYFGSTIQAMFTDEPSLMAVNLGAIPEPARSQVRVVDPLDPQLPELPAIPWVYDLPDRYQQRYQEDLLPHRLSLFTGDTPEDRRIRRQFWALIADLIADRYFGSIEQWCERHSLHSSGHTLWEESILHHVPLQGNALHVLSRMHIPGLDMLNSDPEAVIHGGWLTAALPSSAAVFRGGRRVMTEVSDFSQKMGGAGPAELAAMQATAAWQAAWGVTEFTLYYGIADRSSEDYRAYCQFVGRLNAILKPASLDRPVLLYYPIHDLWEEYLPVAAPLTPSSQSPRAQALISSFVRLGRTLQANQVPFLLVDHHGLSNAQVHPDGRLTVGPHVFEALVLPDQAILPETAATVVQTWQAQGGRVLADRPDAPIGRQQLTETAPLPQSFVPASDRLVVGQFQRDGRSVLLVVNVGREPYQGHVRPAMRTDWLALDPANGTIRPVEADATGAVPLGLDRYQTLLLVETSN